MVSPTASAAVTRPVAIPYSRPGSPPIIRPSTRPQQSQPMHRSSIRTRTGALSPAWLDFAGPAPHALQLAVYFRFPGQVLARLLIFNHGKILLYKMGNSSESTRRPL